MKLLLTGKNGQLGFALQRSLAPLGELLALDRVACDLADPDAIRRVVRRNAPDVIVNAAAYTAVDAAESHADEANAINGIAPGILGEVARGLGALIVHFSTDYVFDGEAGRPYVETDPPNPQSVYGRSKLAGEAALQRSGARHLILRTSWVVGAHGGNFVKTILRLARERDRLDVVADQRGAPTSAALVADATAAALRMCMTNTTPDLSGLYHLTAAGETTWHHLAQHVLRIASARGVRLKLGPECVLPIKAADYAAAARRPANSRLDTTKFRAAFGIDLPDWQTALAPVLDEILRQP